MRSFDGKPEPTPYEREALFRLINRLGDALRQVHGPRPPKPRNIDPDWLPPKDWSPDDDADDEEGED